MKRMQSSRLTTILAASLLAASGAAFAAAPATGTLPAEKMQGSVAYLSGGVGENQTKVFEQAMNKYPLAIEIVQKERTGKRDEFTADAQVRIMDHSGKEVFTAKADGPFVLVRLEPGTYTISTTYEGHTQHRKDVTLAKGRTTHEVFVFPSDQS